LTRPVFSLTPLRKVEGGRPPAKTGKIRIVLSGLRGEDSIAEQYRREGIVENLYYRWSGRAPVTRAKEHLYLIQPLRFFRTQQQHRLAMATSSPHVRAFCRTT